MKSKTLWMLAIGIIAAPLAAGAVRLPALISDNMVLQRDARLNFWGWADPGERVRIKFHGRTLRSRADRSGRWSMTAGPFDAGGPFDMSVMGKNDIEIHNILIGDVWLASGQSNMEFPVRDLGASAPDTAGAGEIRLFLIKHAVAPIPRADLPAAVWLTDTSASVSSFSAVAYLFGRELYERYHVPIGLIEASWGGTTAETWMSARALRRFAEFHTAIEPLARVRPQAEDDYDRYLAQRSAWYQEHGTEDRGRSAQGDLWADPDFNSDAWPTLAVPQPATAWSHALQGFGGVVWLRKEFTLAPEQAGRDLSLNLGKIAQGDSTYLNGEKLGETRGDEALRHYAAPGKDVRAGRNVIAVRMTGGVDADGTNIGMLGPDDKMSVAVGDTRIALSGLWSYQAGPDLTDFPVTDAASRAAHPSPRAPRYAPTVLFNAMINPLTAFRIKGVIWYQGEANALDRRAAQYRTLFPALIQDWRSRWGYEVPFLFVQLAGFGPNKPEPAEYPWAELREAQSMALILPATGMATAVDIGDEEDIHPRNKPEVARRLALQAIKVAYGEDIVSSGPTFQSMQIEGDRIRIKFANLGSGLWVKDENADVRGFEIASADGKFVWAKARQDGEDIVVCSDTLQEPVAVRYDWRNTPDGNLFNREGLPALPFRTDSAPH